MGQPRHAGFLKVFITSGQLGRAISAQFEEMWPSPPDPPMGAEKGGPAKNELGLKAHNLRSLYAEIAYTRFAVEHVSKHSFFAGVLGTHRRIWKPHSRP